MYRLAVKYERCLKDVVFNFTEITQRYELCAGGGMINLFIEKKIKQFFNFFIIEK